MGGWGACGTRWQHVGCWVCCGSCGCCGSLGVLRVLEVLGVLGACKRRGSVRQQEREWQADAESVCMLVFRQHVCLTSRHGVLCCAVLWVCRAAGEVSEYPHELVRQVNSLVSSLPALDNPAFKK